MTNLNDKVIVKENLTFNGASTYNDLTNGVIELVGNFYQKGTRTGYEYRPFSTLDSTDYNARYQPDNAYSFYPTENHKVLLNGEGQQIIAFEAPDSSRFANLEITNPTVDIDVSSGKKIKVIDSLYLDESLYNSSYKDNEYISYGRYRDIHSTYMSIDSGLQIIALPIASSINESQIASIFSNNKISYILKYNSNTQEWQGFGNNEESRKKIANHNVAKLTSIKAGEGFFIKTTGEVELKFPRDNGYDFFNIINTDALSSGWHLLGTNRQIDLKELLNQKENIKLIRNYKNGKYNYLSNDSEIVRELNQTMGASEIEDTNITNSGFWVYVE